MRRLLGCLLVGLLLAGCATPAAEPPAGDESNAMPFPTLDVALAPTDCLVTLLIFLTSMEHAQAQLPDGFTARDAQGVLGAPAPTGQAAIAIANLRCASSALDGAAYGTAELLVFVESPAIDAGLAPSTSDFYAPAFHFEPGPLRDLAVQAQWTQLGDAMTIESTTDAATATSTITLTGAEGTLWDATVTGAAPNTVSAVERIWHATPNGLAFIENDYTNDAHLGVAQCTLAGIAAEVVGATSCEGAEVIGAIVPTQSWKARFVTLPGIHAA